jgi:Peroxisomal biogenesis factor 11 (PEX11)
MSSPGLDRKPGAALGVMDDETDDDESVVAVEPPLSLEKPKQASTTTTRCPLNYDDATTTAAATTTTGNASLCRVTTTSKMLLSLRVLGAFLSSNHDRSLKLLQYSFWAASRFYQADSKGRTGLAKLATELYFTRAANRLFFLPSALATALEACRNTDSTRATATKQPWGSRMLGHVLAWSMVGYYPTEHVAYFHWMAPSWLARGRSAERFSAWSCRCWVAYIVAESALCVLDLKKKSKTSTTTETSGTDNNRQLQQLQLLRNALYIGPAVHWSLPNWDVSPWLSSPTLNALLFLESIVSMIQALKACS